MNKFLLMFLLVPLLAFADTECKVYNPAITKINGVSLPGEMKTLVNVKTMIDTKTESGMRLVITQGTRLAGTRVGIHVHHYGGTTCVLSGAITDFVEGHPPMYWPAGTCYYMPPNTPMSAANLGSEDALLQDIFYLPPDKPTITIVEPGYPACK
jgi:quercetin dioxygenase-like cupin family protein